MGFLRENHPGLKYGDKILASEVLGVGFGSFGNTYYVDATNGSDNNDGTSPDRAKATIAAAISAASYGDIIYIRAKRITAGDTDPSSYAETLTIPVTKPGLALIGVGTGLTQGGLPQIKIGAGSTAMATIQGPGCLLLNLGINGVSSTGGGVLLDDDGSTKTAFGTTIEGCHFKNCTGATASAASGGAIQWAATGGAWQLRVANNRFYKNNGGIVLKGTTGSVPQDVVIIGNTFGSAANTNVDCDIYLAGGSGVSGLAILDNDFQTVDGCAGAGGGIALYMDLTGCKGIMSGNRFACLTNDAASELTFKAAGTAANIPTTVRMSNNWGESSTVTEAYQAIVYRHA